MHNVSGGAKLFIDAPPSRWIREDYRANGLGPQGNQDARCGRYPRKPALPCPCHEPFARKVTSGCGGDVVE